MVCGQTKTTYCLSFPLTKEGIEDGCSTKSFENKIKNKYARWETAVCRKKTKKNMPYRKLQSIEGKF
jgi:hypothetical protein